MSIRQMLRNDPIWTVALFVVTATIGVWPFVAIFVIVADEVYAVKEQQAPAQCTISRAAITEFTRPRFGNGRTVQWIDMKCPTKLYKRLIFERGWPLKEAFPRHVWDALNVSDHAMCQSEKITQPEWVYILQTLVLGYLLEDYENQNPRFHYGPCTPATK